MLGRWVIVCVGRMYAIWQQKGICAHNIFRPSILKFRKVRSDRNRELSFWWYIIRKSDMVQHCSTLLRTRWSTNLGTAEPESQHSASHEEQTVPAWREMGTPPHLRECQAKWTGCCNEGTEVRRNYREIVMKKIHTQKETTCSQGQNQEKSKSFSADGGVRYKRYWMLRYKRPGC